MHSPQTAFMDHPMITTLKGIGDGVSIGTVVATIAGYLPALAALFTIIWTGIRIYETKTVQKLISSRKKKVSVNA